MHLISQNVECDDFFFFCAGYFGNTCWHLQAIISMLFMLLYCFFLIDSNLCLSVSSANRWSLCRLHGWKQTSSLLVSDFSCSPWDWLLLLKISEDVYVIHGRWEPMSTGVFVLSVWYVTRLTFRFLLLQVGVGFLAQYLIKPILGFLIAMVRFLLMFITLTSIFLFLNGCLYNFIDDSCFRPIYFKKLVLCICRHYCLVVDDCRGAN